LHIKISALRGGRAERGSKIVKLFLALFVLHFALVLLILILLVLLVLAVILLVLGLVLLVFGIGHRKSSFRLVTLV
jgi:hypothetical protein